MTTNRWEGYTPPGSEPFKPDFEQPPLERDGRHINFDFLPGTLDQIRVDALAAHALSSEAEAARVRAEMYRRIDNIYDEVGAYVDMLEVTGYPGGMKLKLIPDGVDPAKSKKSDTFDGILWPVVDSQYNNNKAPGIALGPDRRIYYGWKWDADDEKKTYSYIAYAPADLYAEKNWNKVEAIEIGLEEMQVPAESNLEMPPEGGLHRNGINVLEGIDLNSARAEAMAAYNGELQAKKWAEIGPDTEQIDAIYEDARLLAQLWREGGVPGAVKCFILPDGIKPEQSTKGQLVSAVMLPLYHSNETFLKDVSDYMLGPEGRIYEIWVYARDGVTRTAEYHYYTPLDLYGEVESKGAVKKQEIAEGLDNASKATH